MFCVRFWQERFKHSQAMVFAIENINRDPGLLPNVTLGYSIYDTCWDWRGLYYAAMSLVTGREMRFQLDESCVGTSQVLGIIGPTVHNEIASMLGVFNVPMVSLQL